MKILVLLLLFVTLLSAQEGIPWGKEFPIGSSARVPQAVGLTDGGFVICWIPIDGPCTEIYAQRYNAACFPIGGRFRVNGFTEIGCSWPYPSISGSPNGGFVVCWVSQYQYGFEPGIYAQRFNAEGNPIGDELRVSAPAQRTQSGPSITCLSDGGFVICWESWAEDDSAEIIYSQRYNKDGKPTGKEQCIDSCTEGDLGYPRACGLSDGSYVVCWQSDNLNGNCRDIYAQRFNSDGALISNRFCVNGTIKNDQLAPSISGLIDGGFIVCWESSSSSNYRDIYAQRYGRGGNPINGEFRVNSTREGFQERPTVCGLSDGGFVVCWYTYYEFSNGSPLKVNAQRYDVNGNHVGSEFRVHRNKTIDHYRPCVSGLPNGGFIVCWESPSRESVDFRSWGKCFPADPLHHQLRPFVLLQPKQDATVTTTTPTFGWQPASELTVAYPFELEYRVYYDSLADFSTASTNAVNSDTSVVLPVLKAGKTWFWKVLAKTFYGDSLWSNTSAFFVSYNATGIEEASPRPSRFAILSNYPNPFNPSTNITFEIPQGGFVSIKIYDLTGRLVRTLVGEQKMAGLHSVQWDATDASGQKVAAGVYLYQIEFTSALGETMVLTKKMSLVK